MFRRVLTRKKKKKQGVAAQDAIIAEEPPKLVPTTTEEEAAQDAIIHDNVDVKDEDVENDNDDVGNMPLGEPPGIYRTTSPDLLRKAALQKELKKRSLSSKSHARLDMARWNSNASCADIESELVVDPFSVSKSFLEVRTDASSVNTASRAEEEDENDALFRSIEEILGSSSRSESASPGQKKNGTPETQSKAKNSPASILRMPSTRGVAMEKERSDPRPFDEPRHLYRDYSELLQHPVLGTPPRNASRKPSVPTKPNVINKENVVNKEKHTSSYESILDGPEASVNEEDDLLVSKKPPIITVPQPTHRVLPMPQQQQQQARPLSPFSACDETEESKRGLSFTDTSGKTKVRLEEPTDLATYCGLCVESSFNWLLGAPADVWDRCGCGDVCHCDVPVCTISVKNCGSRGGRRRDIDSVCSTLNSKVEDVDSLMDTVEDTVETCSSSEESVDKKGNHAKDQSVKSKNKTNNRSVTRTPLGLHRKMLWVRRRQEADNLREGLRPKNVAL
mmetsp:Transcript_23574/g.44851  ORF Transcript_23574/g.44851 Transcript_23574/m.44851 type:complete len:507 (+) Transcript_23574:132-1652(+)|eukprot:scaffold15108_cov180-Amphora_coffeaeformis.AAC.36